MGMQRGFKDAMTGADQGHPQKTVYCFDTNASFSGGTPTLDGTGYKASTAQKK